MKKTLVTVLTALSIGALAQGSIQLTNTETSGMIVPGSDVHIISYADSVRKFEVDIKNTSTSAKTYGVKRYDLLLHSDATHTAVAYFCFAGGCYTPGDYVSPQALTLNAGQSASGIQGSWQMLLTELEEISTTGLSVVKYTFYDVANSADSVQFTLRYNDPTAGLANIKTDVSPIDLIPNPATSRVNVTTGLKGRLEVQLYNALGQVVAGRSFESHLEQSSVSFDVLDLPSGVYFVSVSNQDAMHTRRLIVQ